VVDFDALHRSLADHEHGRIDVAALVKLWRDSTATAQLTQALDAILMRLESGAMFDEDSCSFSQPELILALRQWL
jgi:hypothetical protein